MLIFLFKFCHCSIDGNDPFLQHVSMQLHDRFGDDYAGAWQTLPNVQTRDNYLKISNDSNNSELQTTACLSQIIRRTPEPANV